MFNLKEKLEIICNSEFLQFLSRFSNCRVSEFLSLFSKPMSDHKIILTQKNPNRAEVRNTYIQLNIFLSAKWNRNLTLNLKSVQQDGR